MDFDALWDRAYSPAIAALGYLPIRADFDSSSAIVKAMLERIAVAVLTRWTKEMLFGLWVNLIGTR